MITLNRPEVRNAVNAALAAGVAGALDELDDDDSLSVGVLTGAGGFFCAGMDLGAFVRGESPWFGDRGFAGISQRASRKPLIAAIERFAVAGGMEIALACDLIVAATRREARDPRGEALAGRSRRRAAAPAPADALSRGDGAGADRRSAAGRALPRARPREPPGRARRAVDAALELAATLARNGPLALIASKRILQEQFDWSSAEMWEKQRAITAPVMASEDATRGCDGVQGEARARLARALAPSDRWRRLRRRWRRISRKRLHSARISAPREPCAGTARSARQGRSRSSRCGSVRRCAPPGSPRRGSRARGGRCSRSGSPRA